MATGSEEMLKGALFGALDRDVGRLKRIFHAELNSDVHFRFFRLYGNRICLLYIEGMADERRIGEFVLRACADAGAPGLDARDASDIRERVIEIAQCNLEGSVEAIVDSVATGMTTMLIDGSAEALLMETRGFPARPVGRTTNESVVIGAQEGFVESLRTNMTLIRRYAPSWRLVTELLTVGDEIPCRVALAYLDGAANAEIVARVRDRVNRVHVRAVRGIGELQQLIEDRPYALLPQMLQTERPDRAAACLMDGQVALLADNSPYALIAPATVFHQLHASDDSFSRWQYGTFLRLIRLAGALISVILPGLYIALSSHHIHLIPMRLVTSIAEARANVPFPVLVEILIMEFSFYLINEAGTRMPQQIGSALGIVGALILGQAAVEASLISPILIIVVALTGLGNYCVPDYGVSVGMQLLRLAFVALAALWGLYGICLGAWLLCAYLGYMRSFGEPYLAPVAPHIPHNADILTRGPLPGRFRRFFMASRRSWLAPEGEGGEAE